MRNMLLHLMIVEVKEVVFWVDLVEELVELGGRLGERMRWMLVKSRRGFSFRDDL